MPSERRFSLLFLSLFLLLAVGGCSHPKGSPAIAEQTTLYIDANLGFAVEHPQDWTRSVPEGPSGTDGTIRWAPATAAAPFSLEVTALSPRQAVGGFDRLLEIFRADQPKLAVTKRESLEVPGATAQKVVGQTPERAFAVVLVTSDNRDFILALSSPPGSFAACQELFDKIVDSFRVLP